MATLTLELHDDIIQRLHKMRRRMERDDIVDVIRVSLAVLDLLNDVSDRGLTRFVASNPATGEELELKLDKAGIT